ncbi:uncharacterized protein LOC134752985 [Cydia strobilella]|uniref:uncharacterized protein LOC134752985 n=1 Tax=Cydia strobilella TaxID=1100964 RepID=UPI003004AD82
MDVTRACRCCLRCPPDKDLTTPYTHLGNTEIYADMIKQCFDINLAGGGPGSCGICSACVGRLRDASDFKLQVQRSQEELQARSQGASGVKEEESTVEPENPEIQDRDGTREPVSGEEPPVKPEMPEDDGTPDEILYDMLWLNMAAGDEASDEGDPLLDVELLIKPELADDDDTNDEMSPEERAVKSEVSDEASDEDCVSGECCDTTILLLIVRYEPHYIILVHMYDPCSLWLKWDWAGHVYRMPPDRWANVATKWMSTKKRGRGRPRRRWRDDFDAFLNNCPEDALNREL